MRRLVATVVVAAVATVAWAPLVSAQEPTTTEIPTRDIVPAPNSGEVPGDAGDRGGALQLALLAVVVLVIAGAAYGLVRQSRRARTTGQPSAKRASQAAVPPRKPER